MYTVYIIENKDNRLYIGSTSNLEQRLLSHNNTMNKGWTNTKGPWNLIYTEVYDNQSDALKREKTLK